MARSLVIVESPAKAKTINKYLGRNYTVKASYGHVRDLPRKTIGILLPGEDKPKRKAKAKGRKKDGRAKAVKAPEKKIAITAENIFEPTYEIIPDKVKIIEQLRTAANSAENVYLATDPDREGEAISFHLLEALATNKTQRAKYSRVMFNEITQKAIKAAFEKPTQVNSDLVDAQQARRVLDRIVGYKVSPLLWDKVRRGLSAGRVQTVALRLIVEREGEIRAFVPREYWTIHALLEASGPPAFEAKLAKYRGRGSGDSRRSRGSAHPGRGTQRYLAGFERGAEREAPLRAATFYDFQAAAGRLQPPALHRQAHHDAGAALV
jgi:DNA topoisomerase-1